jgi:uncharacterized BrkB/YihY/UPF0761 family membrane protein
MFGTALRAWWDDDVMRLGASLAFYTLFAIAPVLLVAAAIADVVFDAEAVRTEIVGQLDSLVGSDGALAVQSLLEERVSGERASSPPRSGSSASSWRPRERSSSSRRHSISSGA